MTQREIFNVMVAIVNDMDNEALAPYMEHILDTEGAYKDVLVQGIEDRIAALDKKKNSSSNKPSKAQIENQGIYDNIIFIMDDGITRTCRQITDNYNGLNKTEFSTNKIQAQITKAVKNGDLVRSVVKGTVYFTKTVASVIDESTDDLE